MAGKITDLATQTGAGAATGDLIETVDISDTSMAGTGTNKKLSFTDLITFLSANGLGGGSASGTKLSALTAITGVNIATNDLVGMVDVSDTTMASSGTNKKTTIADLKTAMGIDTITVSATAPSSPSVNDIWIDIS